MTFTELPRSWTAGEIQEALGISRDQVRALIREGSVGYIRVGRSKRFLTRHIEQIIEAVEVKPAVETDLLRRIGVTSNSAARRRRMMFEYEHGQDVVDR